MNRANMFKMEDLPSVFWRSLMDVLDRNEAYKCCILNKRIHDKAQWALSLHPGRLEEAQVLDFTGAGCPIFRMALLDHKTGKCVR
jgi:hypothetical protein